MHPYVHCGVLYSCQDMEATQCSSIYKWTKKVWHIYTMEYYSATTSDIWPFATAWMDLESRMLSEIRQTEKDKYCVISLICGI